MKGVDFRISPVDQLLGEVAPFHHQPVYLQRKVYLHSNTERFTVFKAWIHFESFSL